MGTALIWIAMNNANIGAEESLEERYFCADVDVEIIPIKELFAITRTLQIYHTPHLPSVSMWTTQNPSGEGSCADMNEGTCVYVASATALVYHRFENVHGYEVVNVCVRSFLEAVHGIAPTVVAFGVESFVRRRVVLM